MLATSGPEQKQSVFQITANSSLFSLFSNDVTIVCPAFGSELEPTNKSVLLMCHQLMWAGPGP